MHPGASLLTAAALLSLLAAAAGQTLPTAWTQGIATHYGGAQDGMDPGNPSFGTKEGSCGYGAITPDSYPYWTVGALSTSNKYSLAGPSQGCGQCFEIQCLNSGGQFAGRCSTSQSIIVTITDSCPECGADHIDLQALTFNKLAPMALGRIDMQYRRVDCTPPNPVTIEIDNNVGVGGWLRLVVEKTAGFGGITAVGIRQSGTQSWQAMNNKFGSAWEVGNAPSLPWDFQFTSDSKQTITAPSLVMQNGQIGNIPTGVQFSLSGSSGATNINFDAQAPPAGGGAPPNTTAPATQAPAQGQPAPVNNAASAGGNCPCTDVQPAVAGGASITCEQQKSYGKCQESWMVNNNYCQLTCGNCPAACSGGTATPAGGAGAAAASVGNGSPAPASPAPDSPVPAGPASPSPTPGGAAPPVNVQSGSVQTSSIGGSTPAPTAAAAAATCTDDTPPGANGKTCADLAATGACYTSIPSQYCLKSCYRAPCPQSGR